MINASYDGEPPPQVSRSRSTTEAYFRERSRKVQSYFDIEAATAELLRPIQEQVREVKEIFIGLVLPHWGNELHGFPRALYGHMMAFAFVTDRHFCPGSIRGASEISLWALSGGSAWQTRAPC